MRPAHSSDLSNTADEWLSFDLTRSTLALRPKRTFACCAPWVAYWAARRLPRSIDEEGYDSAQFDRRYPAGTDLHAQYERSEHR